MRSPATRFLTRFAVVAVACAGCTPVVNPPTTCDPACAEGEVCEIGVCVVAVDPAMEFGFTDEVTDEFAAYTDGGTLPYFTLGQGGSHTFVTIRAAGIAPSADGRLDVRYLVTRQSDGFALSDLEQRTPFTRLADGTLEAERRLLFLLEFPEVLVGESADFTLVVSSPDDPSQSVTVERSLALTFVP